MRGKGPREVKKDIKEGEGHKLVENDRDQEVG